MRKLTLVRYAACLVPGVIAECMASRHVVTIDEMYQARHLVLCVFHAVFSSGFQRVE